MKYEPQIIIYNYNETQLLFYLYTLIWSKTNNLLFNKIYRLNYYCTSKLKLLKILKNINIYVSQKYIMYYDANKREMSCYYCT